METLFIRQTLLLAGNCAAHDDETHVFFLFHFITIASALAQLKFHFSIFQGSDSAFPSNNISKSTNPPDIFLPPLHSRQEPTAKAAYHVVPLSGKPPR